MGSFAEYCSKFCDKYQLAGVCRGKRCQLSHPDDGAVRPELHISGNRNGSPRWSHIWSLPQVFFYNRKFLGTAYPEHHDPSPAQHNPRTHSDIAGSRPDVAGTGYRSASRSGQGCRGVPGYHPDDSARTRCITGCNQTAWG